MESRKIVLMNLFAGKEWRHRCREWTCKHGGKGRERVGWMEKVASTYEQLVRSCCITQGAQPDALWWPTGVVWEKGREAQEKKYV